MTALDQIVLDRPVSEKLATDIWRLYAEVHGCIGDGDMHEPQLLTWRPARTAIRAASDAFLDSLVSVSREDTRRTRWEAAGAGDVLAAVWKIEYETWISLGRPGDADRAMEDVNS